MPQQTAMLKPGDNSIGAILGDGWYAGYFGFHGKREWYGGLPRFIAQLKIEYADGTTQMIATNETWKASYGPIREAVGRIAGVREAGRRSIAPSSPAWRWSAARRPGR
jgi:hypothetical protein